MTGINSNWTTKRFSGAKAAAFFAGISIFIALIFAFGCSSGGTKGGAAVTGKSAGENGDYRPDIASLPVPQGVSPGTFELLKAELLRQLDERFDGDYSKAVSGAPQGDAGKVTSIYFDTGAWELQWSYENKGDYDLSGQVGVPDITPVALHYGHVIDIMSGWLHPIDGWIDGDANGEIGIPDITSIALGYLNEVSGYHILQSDSPDGPWIMVTSVEMPVDRTYPIRFFFQGWTLGVPPYLAVQPYDSEGATGPVSVPVSTAGNQLPVADLVSTLDSGEAPLDVSFDASGSYDPDGFIVGYQFDFDGDGNIDLSTGTPEADYTYFGGGIFDASVTVTDNEGASSTAFVTITVTVGGNVPPEANISAIPTNPEIDETVNFDASFSSDSDGTVDNYEWDFDGDGTYDLDTLDTPYATHAYPLSGTYFAAVRVTDNLGAQDEATVQIDVAPPANYPPFAVLSAMPDGPTTGSFDASGSGDPDGEIVLYQWDWDSDGFYDEDSGNSPYASHDFGAAGTYYVTVQVTDNYGDSATASAWLELQEPHTWTTLNPMGTTGDFRAAAMTMVAGVPAIAAYEYNDSDTKFVLASDSYGTAWGTVYQATSDRGVSMDLIFANGMPCIALESSGSYAAFVRATSATGAAWQTQIQADSTFGSGRYLSLDFAYTTDFFPAIASSSWFDSNLYFAYAQDVSGDAWNPAVTVDEGVGQGYPSLHRVNVEGVAYPAIAYFDVPNESLLFIRANDSAGSTWGTPAVVDSATGDYFSNIRLLFHAGKPVIMYWDMDPMGLKLAVADDEGGTAWSEFHTINAIDYPTARGQDMAIINGNLCVAYTVSGPLVGEDLVYRRNTGPGYGDWSAAETVNTGYFESVTLVDASGIPGVSYIDTNEMPFQLYYSYRMAL